MSMSNPRELEWAKKPGALKEGWKTRVGTHMVHGVPLTGAPRHHDMSPIMTTTSWIAQQHGVNSFPPPSTKHPNQGVWHPPLPFPPAEHQEHVHIQEHVQMWTSSWCSALLLGFSPQEHIHLDVFLIFN